MSERITVQTVVAAPLDQVWLSFTDPRHIMQWNNASSDWHTPHAENDLRVGGSFLSHMESKDGAEGFDFRGTYTVVEPTSRIEYTMEDGRGVSITFSETPAGVEVVEMFEPESENTKELQQAGWQAILDNFKWYTEEASAVE